MKTHSTNELRFTGQVLAKDGATEVIPAIRCGLTNLSGTRLEKAQLVSGETTHEIVVRYADGQGITGDMYFVIGGVLYVLDARPLDAYPDRAQVPNQWLEINAHVERSGR